MSAQTLRTFINQHLTSAAALAGLAALLQARADGVPVDPRLAEPIEGLLASLGADGLLDGLAAEEVKPFLAELRLMAHLDGKLLDRATHTLGWSHAEAHVLQNAGDVSVGFVQPLARNVVPRLAGLAERLNAPGGAFLDAGVGVASLAVAVARHFPALRIVGIDPWAPALALARDNVARAGLTERIELREQAAEDLSDEAAFDLAWIAVPFMQAAVVARAYERTCRALRPGGWALVGVGNPDADPAGAALWRLRTTMFGNPNPTVDKAMPMLEAAGLVDVHALGGPPGAIITLVAGRRAPA